MYNGAETFVAGKNYYVALRLTANDGYKFPEIKTNEDLAAFLSVTMGGVSVPVKSATQTANPYVMLQEYGEQSENQINFMVYWTAEEKPVELNVNIYHSLSLDNSLAISFLVPEDQLAGYTDLRLVTEKKRYKKNSTEYDVIQLELVPEATSSYKGYVQFKYRGIAAKEMGDAVQAVLYATKEGVEYHSKTDSYAVSTYAYNKIREEGAKASLKKLLVDMLNYGAQAQEHFGYNVSNPVNGDLTTDEQKLGTQDDVTLVSNGSYQKMDGAVIEIAGKTLSLESSIEIKYFMTLPETYVKENARLELEYTDIKGNTHKKTVLGKDFGFSSGYHTASFDQIATKDAFQVVTAKLYDGDKLAYEDYYSIETYCFNKTQGEEPTAADKISLRKVCRAMMKYCKSAEEHFNPTTTK